MTAPPRPEEESQLRQMTGQNVDVPDIDQNDELRLIPLEKCGSATWRRQRIQRGVDPDTCFYVANAERIAGKRKIDLESDPPPDIAVEMDITNESLGKFPIYAGLGVPEIWRYDGSRVRI